MKTSTEELFEIILNNGKTVSYKNFDKISGVMAIYIIINKINNKIYIGSTVNASLRKSDHFNKLKRNIHPNRHLQNAYNKYGESVFGMYLLETINDRNKLISKEQHWLDKLKPFDKNIGYNIANIAGTTLGTKHSEESKNKRRINSLGENNPFYGKKHSQISIKRMSDSKVKPIYQFSLNGKFIKEWNSVSDIGKVEGYSRNAIYQCCNHKSQKHKGYIWIYKEEAEKEDFDINNYLPKPYFNNNKAISQCDLDGNVVKEWGSISSASRELNLNKQRIIMCCKGEISTYKNFIWNYK